VREDGESKGQGILKANRRFGDVLESMNFNMVEWQLDAKQSVKSILQLPEKQFLIQKDDLVNFIDWIK
jgi:hypothetical protein